MPLRTASLSLKGRREGESMARQAFVIGGTGQVGRAVARSLAKAGWSVTVASRGQYPNAVDLQGQVRMVTLDRSRPGAGGEVRPWSGCPSVTVRLPTVS
jgi:NAD(P)-dependent dehydrogenase (short-subunit alcohol dehydrogenase family)